MAGDNDEEGSPSEEFRKLLPAQTTVTDAVGRIFTGSRIRFALGLTLLGWALSLILGGTYAVSLGVTIFLAGVIIDELRTLPARGNVRVFEIVGFSILERVVHAVLIAVPAVFAGIVADLRLLFALVPLFLILVIYMGRLLPNRWPYRRVHDVPGVNDMVAAFAAAFFVLTSVLFYNQTRSGLGVLLLLFVLTVRFFTGFTLDDIGAEAEREGIFANQGPPINLPERIGSPQTRKLLLWTNAAAVLLLGLLLLFKVLDLLAVYPLVAYLFSFVFVYLVSRHNTARMARYYAITDRYIFFLLTVIGWAAFRYSGA